MPVPPPDLKGLRRRLDEIDDRLQDLLIDRARVVLQVSASKKDDNQPAFQPAREADILRRLVGRHRGVFPVATLIRMWREMLAATVRLQSLFFSVAVFAPADRPELWDLARDHYGSNTSMSAYDATIGVLRAVIDGAASVGVLPLPEAGEPDPWWPHLLSADAGAPRVVARLPFGARGNARGKSDALAIGRGDYQQSGLDRTLLAAQCSAALPPPRLSEALPTAGLVGTSFARCEHNKTVHLVEVEGFVPISDERLVALRSELGASLERLVSLGGYAVPLPAAALGVRD